MGMSVLLVNYSGSVGFGEQCVQSIIGRIGDIDIEDVHVRIKRLIDKVCSSTCG